MDMVLSNVYSYANPNATEYAYISVMTSKII